MAGFPAQRAGVWYLTEGGQETEIMYRHGHELPEFAMFPLLDDARAVADLRGMYERYLETAARHQFVALMGGLDYRASPDWGAKLGFERAALAEMQMRCIDFLREVAKPFRTQLPAIMIVGIVGPRGDAYALNRTITADEAEDYHATQIETLKRAKVDLVSAMTFNNTAEAVGVSRAAARAGLPLAVYFTLDSNSRLKSGPTVRQAIATVDAEAGDNRPDFYGINCSHPLEFEPALEPGDWIARVRSFRPNAAMMEKQQLCQIGHLVDGDPPELGQQMGALARRYPHVDIWGGCCGTWDAHLNEIAREVRAARD
ncbi:MAG: homocysteine S-methyltransferase family protein [Hyphomonadaceae bacterium]|nr:homocysteine S-methyltransferase family protein [Hyphomonadaceae bacterium]